PDRQAAGQKGRAPGRYLIGGQCRRRSKGRRRAGSRQECRDHSLRYRRALYQHREILQHLTQASDNPMPFVSDSEEQVARYSRHILLPEVGGKGQQKIGLAKVLVVGAGGLGSPVGLYLAAAGVGTIGVIDGDVVDL